MTDATMGGGRGGVGIRLFIEGSALVKRGFDDVADSGKRMWSEIALGQKAGNPALRAMSSLATDAKAEVASLAGQTGAAGRALSQFGATGVLVAAVLGGLAAALTKTREAMSFAADLTDAADVIGIGAEALQGLGYVADESGVKFEKLQGNLEKLNGVVGAFKLGIGDAKLKPVFEELGITRDQLANVENAEGMMMLLADTLGQIKDRATQVKLARAMGVEESLPILRKGSDEVRRLMEEGAALGLVMSDDVRTGLDDADRALEKAEQRIRMSMRVAVSGLADDFANVVTAIADVISWLEKLDGVKITLDLPGRSLPAVISDAAAGRSASQGQAVRDEGIRRQPGWLNWLGWNANRRRELEGQDSAALRAGLQEIAGPPVADGGFETRGHTARGGGSRNNAARDAQRRLEEQQRAREQLAQAETRNDRDILPLRWSGDSALDNENTALETQRLYVQERTTQREALKLSLEKAGILDADVEVRLAGLAEMDAEHDALVALRIAQTKTRELAEARLERETVVAEDAIALLDIQEQLAGTAQERYAIGRRILLAEQELERKVLDAAMRADGIVSDEEQQHYDQVLQGQRGDVAVFDQGESDRRREQFVEDGRAFVQAVKDGKLGETFAAEMTSRLIDGALNQIFDMMNGGGEGGGFLSTAFKAVTSVFGGGRASGGGVGGGYRYGMAEHGPELAVFGTNGQVMSHAETAQMVRDLAGVGGGGGGMGRGDTIIEQHFHNDFENAVVTQDLIKQMNDQAGQAGTAAYARAMQDSQAAAPRSVRDDYDYRR